VVVKPCGFALERTLGELDVLREALPRRLAGPCLRRRRNAYFNRPGPRIVESLEIMAACVHPKRSGTSPRKHARSLQSIPAP